MVEPYCTEHRHVWSCCTCCAVGILSEVVTVVLCAVRGINVAIVCMRPGVRECQLHGLGVCVRDTVCLCALRRVVHCADLLGHVTEHFAKNKKESLRLVSVSKRAVRYECVRAVAFANWALTTQSQAQSGRVNHTTLFVKRCKTSDESKRFRTRKDETLCHNRTVK